MQIDFAGTITIKKNVQSIFILVTVDGVFRYPHAETFKKRETKTAIDYLEITSKHTVYLGRFAVIKHNHSKLESSTFFAKNKNIQLILAPAGDQRGTGMVDRLTQTIKRWLAVLDFDQFVAVIIKWKTHCIKNTLDLSQTHQHKQDPPVEAHFGRKTEQRYI